MAAPPVFAFDNAIVRRPARSTVDGLRAIDRGAPRFEGILGEHQAYVAALGKAGVFVEELPSLEAFPDSVFVEDPALVFPEGAILLRPGAPSRLGEAAEMAAVLRRRFAVVLELEPPGFADGGDVLVTSEAVMIGLSERTDATGAAALVELLARLGRQGVVVTTPPGVLHFKSDCSLLDEATILSTRRLAESGVFARFDVILVPDGEEAAANALRVNDSVFLGDAFPKTAALLERMGYRVTLLATSEIGKVDAGLSCMSLRWHGA